MSLHMIYVCDSCGLDKVTKVVEFSQMIGQTIPNTWGSIQRAGRPPRILCPTCLRTVEQP